MTTLTVSLPEQLKAFAREKAKNDGVTLTFVVQKLLKAYQEGKVSFEINFSDDNTVTKSFDVSSPKGKEKCLEDFRSLIDKDL
jgi:hypothetical protein